jgi:hypothetical protein
MVLRIDEPRAVCTIAAQTSLGAAEPPNRGSRGPKVTA